MFKTREEREKERFSTASPPKRRCAHTRVRARARTQEGGEPVENQNDEDVKQKKRRVRLEEKEGGRERVPGRIIFKSERQKRVNPQTDAWNQQNFPFQKKKQNHYTDVK